MNARQKAKRYKKLYENETRKFQQPLPLQVHNFNTQIIKAQTYVPYEMAYEMETNQKSEYMKIIKDKLARDIAKEIKDIMEINVFDCPTNNFYVIYGKVRIVTRIY